MNPIPVELCICGVCMPPLLPAAILGILLAYVVVVVLARWRVTRYVYHVMLFFLSLAVIFSFIINRFIFV